MVSPLLRAPMVIIHKSKVRVKKKRVFCLYLKLTQGECAHRREEKVFVENSVRESYSGIIDPGVLYTR